MLTIYRSKENIPNSIKYVKDNDAYFDAKSKLLNNDLVKEVLLKIDGAEYVSQDVFLGRNKKLGGLNKIHLSTGAKTLINILNKDNVCFDVVECGINALDLLPMLSEKVNGHIVWKDCLYPFAKNCSCDISYNGKYFYEVFDFIKEVAKEN